MMGSDNRFEPGVLYAFDPPVRDGDRTYSSARCLSRVIGKPDAYLMSGIPEDGRKEVEFTFYDNPAIRVTVFGSNAQVGDNTARKREVDTHQLQLFPASAA